MLDTTQLEKSLRILELSLDLLRGAPPASTEYEVFRNATVKGFELSLDMAGTLLRKALKPFLASAREIDRLTFKDLFRQGAVHGLLDLEAVQRWFSYRDNRNSTAHDYGQAFAEETLALLPAFLSDARLLLEQLRNAPPD